MIHLSPELVSFTQRNRAIGARKNEMNFGQYCTSLYCEFYGVVSDIHQSLEKLSNQTWSFTTDLTLVDEKDLTFSYGFIQSDLGARIDLILKPFGISKITLNLEDLSAGELVTGYTQSSAYKRYFSGTNSGAASLTAALPQRQLTSRFLGDYVIHLMELMLDYIQIAQKSKPQIQKAA